MAALRDNAWGFYENIPYLTAKAARGVPRNRRTTSGQQWGFIGLLLAMTGTLRDMERRATA